MKSIWPQLHLGLFAVLVLGPQAWCGWIDRTVRWLDISGSGLQGADFLVLGRFRAVESLGLDGTRLGDRDLAGLARLPALREISANGTQVTRKGLAALTNSGALQRVRIEGEWVALPVLRPKAAGEKPQPRSFKKEV